MIRSKWASVAFAAASFVATTAGIAGLSNSASAEDVRVTEHTYSGGVKSSLSGGGAKEYHLNCASPAGPGYVEGVGDNRTQPRISGKRGGLVVHFQIAKETKPYAFLSSCYIDDSASGGAALLLRRVHVLDHALLHLSGDGRLARLRVM